jgi:CheY-like chemotaxis protein
VGTVKKILLAEEIKELLDEQKGLLKREGFQVYTATTAEKAMALHSAENMDLIVADIDLPEMGGDKLCSLIKEDPDLRHVYISLVCSGRKPDLRRCGKCGADSYIKKPPELKEVTDKICRILDIVERRDTRVLLKCKVHGSYKDEPFFSTSRDLSVSGILFETDRTLAKGDTISFSFILPDASHVEVSGKVMRVQIGKESAYKCGVKFLELAPGARDLIEEFVRSSGEAIKGEEIY